MMMWRIITTTSEDKWQLAAIWREVKYIYLNWIGMESRHSVDSFIDTFTGGWVGTVLGMVKKWIRVASTYHISKWSWTTGLVFVMPEKLGCKTFSNLQIRSKIVLCPSYGLPFCRMSIRTLPTHWSGKNIKDGFRPLKPQIIWSSQTIRLAISGFATPHCSTKPLRVAASTRSLSDDGALLLALLLSALRIRPLLKHERCFTSCEVTRQGWGSYVCKGT